MNCTKTPCCWASAADVPPMVLRRTGFCILLIVYGARLLEIDRGVSSEAPLLKNKLLLN